MHSTRYAKGEAESERLLVVGEAVLVVGVGVGRGKISVGCWCRCWLLVSVLEKAQRVDWDELTLLVNALQRDPRHAFASTDTNTSNRHRFTSTNNQHRFIVSSATSDPAVNDPR